MAFSGTIPTIQISSNSIINTVIGGVVNNTVNGLLNVGLSTELGQQFTRTLGIPGFQAPENILSSIITPGLVGTGSQVLSEALSSAIIGSNALGPIGPLVAGVTSQLMTRGSQLLLNEVASLAAPQTTDSPNSDFFFPGAGGEEEANYGGSVYNPKGKTGDVVFSIRPAKKSAKLQAKKQAEGSEGGVPPIQNDAQSAAATGTPPSPPSKDSVAKGNALTAVATAAASVPGAPASAPADAPAGASQTAPTGAPFSSLFGAFPGGLTSGLPKEGLDQLGRLLSQVNLNRSSFPAATADLSGSQIGAIYSLPPSRASLTGLPRYMELAAATKEWWKTLPTLSSSSTASSAGGELLKQDLKDLGWKFTTAPRGISWETSAKVERVAVFGSNRPPVVGGSRGMRDLSLSEALIEGFSFGKSVESKVIALESLLDYTLTKSYVKVPVYWVTASDKKYGQGNGDGGFFVIKSIKVTEELRDFSGRTTRAKVDVSFMQVPEYQVDDGRDMASKSVTGGQSILDTVAAQVDKFQEEQRRIQRAAAAAAASRGTGAGADRGAGGCGTNKVAYQGGCVAKFKTVTTNGVTRVLTFDPETGTYK
jgi:hypothetical protein